MITTALLTVCVTARNDPEHVGDGMEEGKPSHRRRSLVGKSQTDQHNNRLKSPKK